MGTYKIRISPRRIRNSKLASVTYSSKKQAISALMVEFEKKGYKFSVVVEGKVTRFLNESGEELSAVMPD